MGISQLRAASDSAESRESAVLVPVYRGADSAIRLVLVRRSRVVDTVDSRDELMSFPGWAEPRLMPVIVLGRERLCGATLRIPEPVLPRLLAGEWAV